MKKKSDLSKLVNKAQRGDEESILAILSKKKNLIYSYIRRNLSKEYYSHIDEIFSEARTEILDAIINKKIRKPDKISSFIISLTINTTRKYYKREIKKPIDIIERLKKPMTPWQKAPNNEVENDINRKELLEKIKLSAYRLNRNDRKLITLKIFEELTFEQIALIYEIDPSTAKRRFDKAMKRLQKIILEGNS